jgi:hypothetical protein
VATFVPGPFLRHPASTWSDRLAPSWTIRGLVGLDRDAVTDALSTFIAVRTLTARGERRGLPSPSQGRRPNRDGVP